MNVSLGPGRMLTFKLPSSGHAMAAVSTSLLETSLSVTLPTVLPPESVAVVKQFLRRRILVDARSAEKSLAMFLASLAAVHLTHVVAVMALDLEDQSSVARCSVVCLFSVCLPSSPNIRYILS